MTQNPLVSVLIPTYNRKNLLLRALKSVFDQTYHNLEVVVVDDASTDNTEKSLRKSRFWEKTSFIRHQENKGAPASRNTAVKNSSGDFIAFLDSDDVWHPVKIKKQIEVLQENPEYSLVFTKYQVHKSGKTHTAPHVDFFPQKRSQNKLKKLLYKRSFILNSSVLVKRSCLKKAGLFDESLPSLEDWELWIRFADYCRFFFIPQVMVEKYSPPDQITRDKKAFVQAIKLILEKHKNWYDAHPFIKSWQMMRAGRLLLKAKKIKKAGRWFKESIKTHPFSPVFWLFEILSLFISSIR